MKKAPPLPLLHPYSNATTGDRRMREWLMWRFAELNRDRPLPAWRRHLRWCGLCSAAARGVFGNTQWAASMHAKNVASYRWNPRKRSLSLLKRYARTEDR